MPESKVQLQPPPSFLYRLKYWIDAQECAWLPPWGGGKKTRECDVRDIRKAALRLNRNQNRENISPLALFTRTMAWPFVLIYRSWQASAPVKVPGFIGRLISGCRDLVLYNVRSESMRIIREQRPDDYPELARLYVTDRENQALLIHLNQQAPSASLGDKIAFDQFCRRHGFAHIPVIAHSDGETPHDFAWPKTDLFIKTSNLWGGQDARALRYDSSSSTWQDETGEQIKFPELMRWVQRIYAGKSWLIQTMLTVDPLWSQWSPGPIGTVRIVTVIVSPGAPPEIIAASMRLPRTDMVVDNFSAGALSAEIDWRTGRLGPALGHDTQQQWNHNHPDTHGLINGAVVPAWQELCKLAIHAHTAASDLVSVGWDITCHQGIPVLVEANPVYNLAPTVVLGETKWLEAMLARKQAILSPAIHS